MNKFKVGDRVKVRQGNLESTATISAVTTQENFFKYAIERKVNDGSCGKVAWFPENDVVFLNEKFTTPCSKTMRFPIQELREYYRWSLDNPFYGKKQKPTLLGWIKYWRKTVEDHPEWKIVYKSEQRPKLSTAKENLTISISVDPVNGVTPSPI